MRDMSRDEQMSTINEVQLLAKVRFLSLLPFFSLFSHSHFFRKMDSDFVVEYHSSFIEHNYLHIIMEFCDSGDLARVITASKDRGLSALPLDFVWQIFPQVSFSPPPSLSLLMVYHM